MTKGRANQMHGLLSFRFPHDLPDSNQDSTSSRLKISVWSLYEKISP
ncbi:hypothetical protein P3T16_004300 [Paraburkholderia sp. GAS42]